MKIFVLKSAATLSLMFICVLAGITIANDGMNQMKGHPTQSLSPRYSSAEEQGEEPLTSHDLGAKKRKLEEMNALNLFSEMGRAMATGISKSSKSLLQSIASEK